MTVSSSPVCFGTPATVTAIPNPAGNYDYSWTVPLGAIDPGNTPVFTTNIAGDYSVVITDKSTTCPSLPGQGTVIINLVPTVTVSSPPQCLGTPVTVTALPNPAGVYDYTWTVPVGATDPGNTSNFTTTTAGDYSVIITDKNTTCPSLPGLGTVIINLMPTVLVTSPVECIGTPATVTALPSPSGVYDYVWTVPSGVTDPGNVSSFTTTTEGDYSVIISDKITACPSLPSQVTVLFNLIPTVIVSSAPECFGNPATVTAMPNPVGNYDYTWTVPLGAIDPGNNSSFTTTTVGDYSVVITGKTTLCTSLPSQGTVLFNLIPTVTVSSAPQCLGTLANVTAVPNPLGDYDFVWTVPVGAANPGNTSSFTTNIAGDYSVVISDKTLYCPSQPGLGNVLFNDLPIVTISSDATICSGGEASVIFTGTPNATVSYNVNGGANQTIVLNGSGEKSITDTFLSNTNFNLVSVTSAGIPSCTQPQIGSMEIIIAPVPFVSISSDITICPDSQAEITFLGTANATVTYNVNGGSNLTIDLDNDGKASLINTYSVSTIIELVSIKTLGTPGCIVPTTGVVNITILPLPTATITSSSSICPGEIATITINGTPNANVVYSINGGGNLTVQLDAAGNADLNSMLNGTTVYTLVSVTYDDAPNCINLLNSSVTININPLPTVSISSTDILCSGSNGNVTFIGTPNSIVTYTINGGSNQFINIDASGVAIFTSSFAATSTFNLVSVTLVDPPACSTVITGSTTIEVKQIPNAGTNAAISICDDSIPQDLLLSLGSSADLGGSWSPGLSSGTGFFDPLVDLPGSYIYTVAGTPPCVNATSLVVVTIAPSVNAGTDSIAKLCSNSDPIDLITFLGSSAQVGGTWSPALISGTGIFDPAVDSSGNYTYTLSGIAPCNDKSAMVSVTVIQGINAGISGSTTLCVNNPKQDLFLSLGGTPQTGGVWSPVLSGGSGFFDPAIDPSGIYTYTLTGDTICGGDSATVTALVNPVPDAGEDATVSICSNTDPKDLITYLGGTPQVGGTWSPSLASGTGVFNPKLDLAGSYTYTVGPPFCGSDVTTLTINIVAGPDAGISANELFCVNGADKDLFLSLGVTAQPGGIWSPPLASGSGVFNPAVDNEGVYTYTVAGNLFCEDDTATVTVKVDQIANAGTFVGKQNVCTNVINLDLLSLLTGGQIGGTWKDNLNQTVGNTINISNFSSGIYSYTYTVLNSCGTDSEVVQFEILPNPILMASNIAISSPNCKGDNVNINFTNMIDGVYTLNYNLSIGNVLNNQNANVTILNGKGMFTLNSTDIPNSGTTRVTFLNIINTVSLCTTVFIPNVSADFVLRPLPSLENNDLSVANICIGSDVKVLITGSTAVLPDGNYQFEYQIAGDNPTTTAMGTVAIAAGVGQFTVPTSYFSNAGDYSLTISSMKNLSSTCINLNEDANVSFKVYPYPNIIGTNIAANAICANFSNEVSVTGASNLIDGNYTIKYQLSGANNVNTSTPVAFVNGKGSFFILGSNLISSGTVTLTVEEIVFNDSNCGVSANTISPITFEVNHLDTPILGLSGNVFCGDDNPNVDTLSDRVTNASGTDDIIWYKNETGNDVYNTLEYLVDGATYYGVFQSATGCESNVRLALTISFSDCVDIIIPDGFSPNEDGINDTFVIENLRDKYPDFKIEIYNRYGNILFKGNKNTPDWNGITAQGGIKLGDSKNPVGVYFYILEFNSGVKKPLQGRLYLSR